MALSFGRSKSEDVVSLIAAKKYGPAIEILREELKKRGASTTVRKQLADVLVLSGKTVEAVSLLLPLADKFAREGFAAKAVSVLKKIQKIDPGRSDVEERLARLIEEKQRQAAVALPRNRPGLEIGIEEIGMEPPPSAPVDIPLAPPAAEPEPAPSEGAGPELGFGGAGPIPTPALEPVVEPPAAEPISTPAPGAVMEPPAPETAEPVLAPPPEPAPLEITPTPKPGLADTGPDATLPLPAPDPPPGVGEWLDLEGPSAVADQGESEIEDYDLLYVPDGEEAEEEGADEEIVLPEPSAHGALSEGGFADELMSLVDSVFQESPGTALEPATTAEPEATPDEAQQGGSQIVVSPLFRDFSVDEMVAVIQGLNLLTFERGEVILREGKPGGSLYMLASGRVRAFRKNRETGKQVPIGDLEEGAFFGEMSILTGQPRTASIVALNSCELLELDRPTLDGITKTHPHVWDVLREFAEQRSQARG
ncbi:MAG: cyclic nucleotide-binding domain-containing protein [Acidobacteriota bacterium]